jgi:prepilin-type N-terminal cleavage/methylation domain-containing protein
MYSFLAHRGFTLVEMVVVIALVGMLGSLTAFADIHSYTRALAGSDVTTVLGALSEARGRAMHGVCFETACVAPASHGVLVDKDSIVIFEGQTYSDRIQAADEVLPLSAVHNSTSQETVFNSVTGEVLHATSLSFSNGSEEAWRIDIAQSGLLTPSVSTVTK